MKAPADGPQGRLDKMKAKGQELVQMAKKVWDHVVEMWRTAKKATATAAVPETRKARPIMPANGKGNQVLQTLKTKARQAMEFLKAAPAKMVTVINKAKRGPLAPKPQPTPLNDAGIGIDGSAGTLDWFSIEAFLATEAHRATHIVDTGPDDTCDDTTDPAISAGQLVTA